MLALADALETIACAVVPYDTHLFSGKNISTFTQGQSCPRQGPSFTHMITARR